jgi:hypothetical protein
MVTLTRSTFIVSGNVDRSDQQRNLAIDLVGRSRNRNFFAVLQHLLDATTPPLRCIKQRTMNGDCPPLLT